MFSVPRRLRAVLVVCTASLVGCAATVSATDAGLDRPAVPDVATDLGTIDVPTDVASLMDAVPPPDVPPAVDAGRACILPSGRPCPDGSTTCSDECVGSCCYFHDCRCQGGRLACTTSACPLGTGLQFCSVDADCPTGLMCQGVGGCEVLRTCVPARACTGAPQPYCGCDGVTFTAPADCAGRDYLHRGPCAGPPCVLPTGAPCQRERTCPLYHCPHGAGETCACEADGTVLCTDWCSAQPGADAGTPTGDAGSACPAALPADARGCNGTAHCTYDAGSGCTFECDCNGFWRCQRQCL